MEGTSANRLSQSLMEVIRCWSWFLSNQWLYLIPHWLSPETNTIQDKKYSSANRLSQSLMEVIRCWSWFLSNQWLYLIPHWLSPETNTTQDKKYCSAFRVDINFFMLLGIIYDSFMNLLIDQREQQVRSFYLSKTNYNMILSFSTLYCFQNTPRPDCN